jgi:hypothetical protein
VIIRSEQIAALAGAARDRFEEKLVAHLHGAFPRRSAQLAAAGIREVIRYGIARAREYDIVRQRDVASYITIMFMFGPKFDSQPSSGPLYAVLRDPRLKGSRARARALHLAALTALRTRTRRTGRKPVW